MLSISPTVSLALNAILAAITSVGAASSTDPNTQKIVIWAGAITSVVNVVLHAFSSSSAGPLASTPAATPAAKS